MPGVDDSVIDCAFEYNENIKNSNPRKVGFKKLNFIIIKFGYLIKSRFIRNWLNICKKHNE
ncbi:hypothetical protein GCM10009122_25850 [Fulvivirga kasyanovii]